MADTPSPGASTDVVTDLIARYGRQAVQLFAALAGATGLFYSIGFLIVNVSLLRLGVYETALINVGYVVPGIAFAVIFTLSAIATIGAFQTWLSVFGPGRLRRLLAALAGVATLVAGSYLLGWAMWFFQDIQNIALGLVIWAVATNLGVAIMAYAEYLPAVDRMVVKRVDEEGNPMSRIQARLKSPAFVLVAALLTFFSVLFYGQFAYDQVLPVFGGGLPSVVRFFGENVGELDRIGINLEPGETALTERVELIAQTEDRYIVRVANRAVSFDKLFVQGIRYELTEFFLDPAFFLATHTKQGERFLDDEQYDDALSEFNLVLDREPRYAPALRGRVRILIDPRPDFDQALQDYLTLTDVEPQNGEHFYGLARVHVPLAQSRGLEPDVDNVVLALTSAKTISATLGENAKADPVFDPLRGTKAFDVAVYGSGPAGARYFRDSAKAKADSGAIDEAIAAYRRALDYVGWYPDDPEALSIIEIANLHVDLSALYDPLSDEALAELQAAVDVAGQEQPSYLNQLADLYLRRGDTTHALETYELALDRLTANDPDRRQALIGLGELALAAQDYLRASAAFGQAVMLSASDAVAWYNYARALAALGDPGTETALRRAFELDLSRAATAQTGDWAQYFSGAGSLVENLINGAAAFKQARDFRDQNDLDAAIAAYQDAAAADDRVAAYRIDLGNALTRAERHADAVAAYQAALLRLAEPDPAALVFLGSDQSEPTVLVSLGSAQIESGDAAGAIESLTNAITAQGDAALATTHALLGRAYMLTEQYDLAASAYDAAALRSQDNLDYPYRSGIASLLAGEIERGLATLDRVIAQGRLSVESSDAVGLRDTPSINGLVLKTLSVGTQLQIITGRPPQPEPDAGQVWWQVVDQDGTEGWVSAADVAPFLLAPATQFPAP